MKILLRLRWRRSFGIHDFDKLLFIPAHHNFRNLMYNFLSGLVHVLFVYLVEFYIQRNIDGVTSVFFSKPYVRDFLLLFVHLIVSRLFL